tara:strand:+ start:689 stop:1234 length:546 start_codon:yes stop_codon:yes gene_type:complete
VLYVEKAIPNHAFDLAFKLRPMDNYEVCAMGNTPLEVLVLPFRYTRKGVNTYTVLDDGNVVAMFGVVSNPHNLKHGTVWMLSSEELDKHWKYFTKRTKKWANYFLSDYEYVANYITIEHKTNIKWLKWLGFSFNSEPLVVKGNEVLYFYKKIQGVSKNIQPVLDDLGPVWATDEKLKVDNC